LISEGHYACGVRNTGEQMCSHHENGQFIAFECIALQLVQAWFYSVLGDTDNVFTM